MCDDDSLLLMDDHFVIREQMIWRYGSIYHLIWVESLNRYLVVNDRHEIYLINEKNFSSVERIESIPTLNWWSATVCDKYLFLSTYGESPVIVQADVSQSYQLVKKTQGSFQSTSDEFIQELNTWNDKLIVVVSNQKERTSVCQVRSPSTFNLFSTIPLNFRPTLYQSSIHSTVLFPPTQRLIFIEENSTRMIVVNLDGKTQSIEHSQPIRNLCSYRRSMLVIRTDRAVVFYQL